MAVSEVDFVLVESRAMLRDALPLIDEGVEAVLARTPDEPLCGGDVYSAAIRGECEVRLVRADSQVFGFVATTVNVSLVGERTLFVWLLYVVPGAPDTIAGVVAELDFMAYEQGCMAVEFATARPAWERRLSPHGYRPKTIVFRKEVTNE